MQLHMLIPYLFDARTKIPIAAVKLILYFTGTSEKVVIVSLLARVSVAPISVTYVLGSAICTSVHRN